jgi:hypothetical protein
MPFLDGMRKAFKEILHDSPGKPSFIIKVEKPIGELERVLAPLKIDLVVVILASVEPDGIVIRNIFGHADSVRARPLSPVLLDVGEYFGNLFCHLSSLPEGLGGTQSIIHWTVTKLRPRVRRCDPVAFLF